MPAVAGQFYAGDAIKLAAQVANLLDAKSPKDTVKAILCPHAGFMYSGAVAGAVYSRIKLPGSIILLGPNHTGLGAKISMASEGQWSIPTGDIQVDSTLAIKIARDNPLVTRDDQAHMFEHSLEVQLPFIAHLAKNARIVPITVMSASFDELRSVGESIARAIMDTSYPVLIVASSDMSHYISANEAKRKDKKAIDMILGLNPEGLYDIVRKENITMCGVLPAVIMLAAALALGAKKAELIRYATSGDVSGDYESVVGYAGITIK